MQQLRCLIVDDERHCRLELTWQLEKIAGVSVIGNCCSLRQAQETIQRIKPDALFLDVRIGMHSGFELLKILHNPPIVVFVTAFDEFASQAFQTNAVDYLLKPVQQNRLQAAVERIRRQLCQRQVHVSLPAAAQ
jgi:two-component system LytT family response regulator